VIAVVRDVEAVIVPALNKGGAVVTGACLHIDRLGDCMLQEAEEKHWK